MEVKGEMGGLEDWRKKRGEQEKGLKRKRWKPIWRRTTCPGKTESSKDSLSWEIREIMIDMPNLCIQIYKYNNWVVWFYMGSLW